MTRTLVSTRWLRALGFALALLAGLGAALGTAPARADDQDPPARVGRISALRGQVDLSAEPGAAWDRAQLNQPVTGRTALWAPPGSQAEVRIGSSAVRLDGNTQAVFSQLDDYGIAVDVAQGTVRARVRNLPGGDRFSLAADGVRAEAQGPGDYRVSYDADRRAYSVRTLAGRLRVVTANNSFNLEPGQEAMVDAGGASLQVRAINERDDFDLWAEARDREQDRLASTRYVSPEMTGVEALDDHGYWESTSDYGAVWYPRAVPVGWAPYRYGHWAWVAPWGWTWVDDSPWGFAPFHYGRWALIGSRWAWCPGPIVARPVWAPALVGYVGGRSGSVSISIGIGSAAPIGWFPLAPAEAYYPTYRYSPRYVQQINVINVTNVVNVRPAPDRRMYRHDDERRANYRYAQRPEALTVVREDDFRSARPIGRRHIELTQQQAAQLQPVAATVPGDRGRNDAPATVAPRGPGQARLPVAVLPAPAPRVAQRDDDDKGPPRARIGNPRVERPQSAEPDEQPRRPRDSADGPARAGDRDQRGPANGREPQPPAAVTAPAAPPRADERTGRDARPAPETRAPAPPAAVERRAAPPPRAGDDAEPQQRGPARPAQRDNSAERPTPAPRAVQRDDSSERPTPAPRAVERDGGAERAVTTPGRDTGPRGPQRRDPDEPAAGREERGQPVRPTPRAEPRAERPQPTEPQQPRFAPQPAPAPPQVRPQPAPPVAVQRPAPPQVVQPQVVQPRPPPPQVQPPQQRGPQRGGPNDDERGERRGQGPEGKGNARFER